MKSATARRLATLRKTANAQYDAGNKAGHLAAMEQIRAITTAEADKFSERGTIAGRSFPT